MFRTAALLLASTLVLASTGNGCSGDSPVSPQPAVGSEKTEAAPEESGPGAGGDTGSDAEPAPEGEKTAVIDLTYDQPTEHRDLELRWLDLEDSRCPQGVVCVWAGRMIAKLEATQGEGDPVALELVHTIGDEPEVGRAFGYEFRLLDVSPHPKAGVSPEREQFVATVEITKP